MSCVCRCIGNPKLGTLCPLQRTSRHPTGVQRYLLSFLPYRSFLPCLFQIGPNAVIVAVAVKQADEMGTRHNGQVEPEVPDDSTYLGLPI